MQHTFRLSKRFVEMYTGGNADVSDSEAECADPKALVAQVNLRKPHMLLRITQSRIVIHVPIRRVPSYIAHTWVICLHCTYVGHLSLRIDMLCP